MGQRRPMAKRHDDHEAVPRWEFEQLKEELLGEITRSKRQIPVWINIQDDPDGGPDGTGGYTWRFRGAADTALAADEIVTDGAAPGSSPTPTVTGGITMLFIKWTPVVNADEVTYEVHLSASSGFTPDSSTLLTDTQGFMVTTRTLPDGTPLAQATTYYAKIIARDADSAAAASAEDSAQLAQVTDPDIATDAIIARHILAEEIQASHLEAAMVLVNTLIAGAGAATTRIEIGVAQDPEDSFIGIRAFDSEGLDTLRVDAETGKLYVRGEIDWGTASRLDEDDVIIIKEQPLSFQVPAIRQRSAGGAFNLSGLGSMSRTFGSASLAGNTLILHVFQWREGTTTPGAVATPTHYTLLEDRTGSGTFGSAGADYRSRQQVFIRENAPPTSSLAITAGSGSPTHATMDFLEVRGTLTAASVDSSAEGSSAGTSSGGETAVATAGTLAQAESLALSFHSVFVHEDDVNLEDGVVTWHHESGAGGSGTPYGFSDTPNIRTIAPTIGTCTMYEQTSATTALTHEMMWEATPAFDSGFGFESYIMVLKAAPAAVSAPEATWTKLYAKYAAGPDASVLHTISEDGQGMSLVGGPVDARWRIEHVEATFNLPSLAAHTSGSNLDFTVTQGAGVDNVEAGDIIVFLGFDEDDLAVPVSSSIIFTWESIASEAGHIKGRWYNAHTGSIDVGTVSFQFLVIHLG